MAMATDDKDKHAGTVEKEEEEKWVKHYSSSYQILLVGDGDFSFSLCLALSFGSASNICASSLDSYDTVIKKYKRAKSNLETLKKLGAYILHGVDATKMKFHPDLRIRKFDRIIFNFPHAGFYGKEDKKHIIEMHRRLVGGFFRNASGMLRANGEVHVSHKTAATFRRWNLGQLALGNSLSLSECVSFKIEDYPGYNNKRGDGLRCDEPFPLGECSTFKFRLSSPSKKKSRVASDNGFANRRAQQLRERSMESQKQETTFDFRHLFNVDINEFPGSVGLPLTMNIQRESPRISYGCFSNFMSPRAGNVVDYFAHESHRFDCFRHLETNYTRNMNDFPGYVRLPLTTDIQRGRVRIFDGSVNNLRDTLGRSGHNLDYFAYESRRFDSFRHLETNCTRKMNDLAGYVGLPLTTDIQRESLRIFDGCINNFGETLGRSGHNPDYSVHGTLISDS